MRRFSLALALLLATISAALALTPNQRVVLFGGTRPYVEWNFAVNGLTPSCPATTCAAPTDSRLSSATYFNSAGILSTVGNNVVRFTYNPATLRPLGILAEPAATNLQPYSNFASGWTAPAGTTITTGQSDPTGGTAAVELTDSSTSTNFTYFYNSGITVGIGNYASSFFVQNVSRRYAYDAFNNSATGWVAATFDLVNVVETQGTAGAGGTFDAAAIFPGQSGWDRIVAVGALGSSGTNGPFVGLSNTGTPSAGSFGNYTYTGNGSSIVTFGVQFENSLVPTSYIATGASSASRSADKITATCPVTGGPITAVVGGVTPPGIGAAIQIALDVCDSGGATNEILIYRNTSRQMACQVVSGGSTQATVTMGTVADSTAFTVSCAVSAAGVSASLNGGAPVTAGAITLPTSLSKIRFGTYSSVGEEWGGTIGYVKFFNSYQPTITS